MTIRIAYRSIDLTAPARLLMGRPKADSLEAVDGRTISFVDDGESPPYFIVEGHLAVKNYRINPANIVGGVLKTGEELEADDARAEERKAQKEYEAKVRTENRPERPKRPRRPDDRRGGKRRNPNAVERIRPGVETAAPELEEVVEE